MSVSTLPGKIETNEFLHFYSTKYNYLIKTQLAHFVKIYNTLADSLSSCLIVQLLTVNI